MKKIMVLSTGGTISTQFCSSAGGLVPKLNADKLVSKVFQNEPFDEQIQIVSRTILLLNSSTLSMSSLCAIRECIQECFSDDSIDGIVVTHGTGMMEETAYFLDSTLDVIKPVVLTGAQRSIDQQDFDGARNISESILVAASGQSKGQGILVVFNSEIFAARDVTKVHSTSVQAFSSGSHGLLGIISLGKVIYYRKTIRPEAIQITSLEENVDLIKFTIGADARFIECSIAHGAKGIVIEGSGTGNVNESFYNGILSAIKHNILVGITTRTYEGRSLPIYANIGGGATLQAAGAIMLGDLSGQKARLLLMAALSDGRSIEQSKALCLKHAM